MQKVNVGWANRNVCPGLYKYDTQLKKEKKLIKQRKFIKDGKGKLPLAERMLPVHQVVFHFPPES